MLRHEPGDIYFFKTRLPHLSHRAGHPLSPRGFVRLGPLRPHGGHDVAMSSLGGERCNGRSAVSGLQSWWLNSFHRKDVDGIWDRIIMNNMYIYIYICVCVLYIFIFIISFHTAYNMLLPWVSWMCWVGDFFEDLHYSSVGHMDHPHMDITQFPRRQSSLWSMWVIMICDMTGMMGLGFFSESSQSPQEWCHVRQKWYQEWTVQDLISMLNPAWIFATKKTSSNLKSFQFEALFLRNICIYIYISKYIYIYTFFFKVIIYIFKYIYLFITPTFLYVDLYLNKSNICTLIVFGSSCLYLCISNMLYICIFENVSLQIYIYIHTYIYISF